MVVAEAFVILIYAGFCYAKGLENLVVTR